MKKIFKLLLVLSFGLVLVACGGKTPVDKHQQVFDYIQIGFVGGDSSVSVTNNIFLPQQSTVAGATLNWISTDPDVISSTGVVVRPEGNSKLVVLVLEVTIDGVTREKNFRLTVLPVDNNQNGGNNNNDGGNNNNDGGNNNNDGGNNNQTTFTVSFNSDGGSPVNSQTVTSGSTITPPMGVTKAGFVLDGWYKDTNLTNKWNFVNDTVTNNLTLYAKWIIASTEVPTGYIPISTKEGYLGITDLTKNYILTADIDFEGGEVAPLGDWDSEIFAFSGTFDGNGYALMNFTITGSNYSGLKDANGDSFGTSLFPTLTGSVKNLNIINAVIVGDGFSGGVAGLNEGHIENVYFEGKVTASKSWGSTFSWAVPAGGIAGILGGKGSVNNVFIDAEITGGHIFFGYAFSNAANLLAVKETLHPEMILQTGMEKENETDYLVKNFVNAQVVSKTSLPSITNFGLKWSTTNAIRPYLVRVDGNVPSWALR